MFHILDSSVHVIVAFSLHLVVLCVDMSMHRTMLSHRKSKENQNKNCAQELLPNEKKITKSKANVLAFKSIGNRTNV